MNAEQPETINGDSPEGKLRAIAFTETPEMAELKPVVIDAMARLDFERLPEALGTYQDVAKRIIDTAAPPKIITGATMAELLAMAPDRSRLEVALEITVGLMWQEAGRSGHAIQEELQQYSVRYGNRLSLAYFKAKEVSLDDLLPPVKDCLLSLLALPPTEEIIRAFIIEFSADEYEGLGTLTPYSPEDAIIEVINYIVRNFANLPEDPFYYFAKWGWVKG